MSTFSDLSPLHYAIHRPIGPGIVTWSLLSLCEKNIRADTIQRQEKKATREFKETGLEKEGRECYEYDL